MNKLLPRTGLHRNIGLQVIMTLIIGSSGALAAITAGLPAAALIGSTTAVSACSFYKLPIFIPVWLRHMAFAALGCSLGSGVGRDLIDLVAKWPLSLCVLVLVMGTILLTSSWVLTTFYGQSKETAVLAASPGALSYSLAVAATGIGDAQSIMVIQSIRLLSITTALPLVLDLLCLQSSVSQAASLVSITLAATAGLYLATLVVGFFLNKQGLPAAFLIAGVLISGLSHYFGMVVGRPPTGFIDISFVITGAVIGARFTHIPMADIRRLLGGSMTIVLVSTCIAAMFAALTAKVLGLPFGQVWVSYAPGGVEAMAAMAIALGYDSAFVATHHIIRIILLFFLLPVLLKLFRKTAAKNE